MRIVFNYIIKSIIQNIRIIISQTNMLNLHLTLIVCTFLSKNRKVRFYVSIFKFGQLACKKIHYGLYCEYRTILMDTLFNNWPIYSKTFKLIKKVILFINFIKGKLLFIYIWYSRFDAQFTLLY